MNIFKKISASVLVLAMVLSSVACGNESKETQSVAKTEISSEKTQESKEEESSEETTPAEREHVELNLYNYTSLACVGAEETYEEINRYLKEKLNTTINFHIYKTSDYKTTVPTMIQSGADDMDIIFTRQNNVDFLTHVNMNAFAPIEEYKDEYLKGTQSVVTEAAWDALTVNGHLYAVPVPRDSATSYNVHLNTTMMEDLGLTFPEEYRTYFDLIDFLYEAKAVRDKKYPEKADQPIIKEFSEELAGFFSIQNMGSSCYTNVPGLSGFEGMGDGETVFCPYLTEDYREWAKLYAQLVKDGIIPFDQKSYDPDKVLTKNGEFLFEYGLGTIFLNEEISVKESRGQP